MSDIELNKLLAQSKLINQQIKNEWNFRQNYFGKIPPYGPEFYASTKREEVLRTDLDTLIAQITGQKIM